MRNERSCIDAKDLRLQTEDGTLWSNITFALDVGQQVLLTGLTPAARTVLLRMIAGLKTFDTGSIFLWNKPITEFDRHWLSAHVRYITSRDRPGFSFPVQEFISKGCEFRLRPLRTPDKEEVALAQIIMKDLELTHLARRDCSQLGKSDSLRVSVAQAMICQPALLLIDDPLDEISEDIRGILLRYFTRQAASGRTIVMTGHGTDHLISTRLEIANLDDHAVLEKKGEPKQQVNKFIF